jgi:hypothetical protein
MHGAEQPSTRRTYGRILRWVVIEFGSDARAGHRPGAVRRLVHRTAGRLGSVDVERLCAAGYRGGPGPPRRRAWASEEKSVTYRCVTGPADKGCGGILVNAEILDEYVTGAVLDALESPAFSNAVQAGEDTSAPRRAARNCSRKSARPRTSGPKPGGTGPTTPSTRLTG